MQLSTTDLSMHWRKASLILQKKSFPPKSPIEFAEDIGVELYPGWIKLVDEFFNSKKNYKELICCMGMKSGKTYMTGFFCCYELYLLSLLDNPASFFNLDPDSWIYGICAARNRDQAKDGVFAEFIAKARRCEFFEDLQPEEQTYVYKLHGKKLCFMAGPSNSDALVSHTLAFAVLDEMSRFKSTSGERSARSVYDAVSHQLGLLDGRLYIISSPLYVDDWVMQLLDMSERHSRMLGFQKATWEMNPNFPRDHPAIIAAFEKNPEAARRDYEAIPSLALEPFFAEPHRIDLCIREDLRHPLDAHDDLHDWFSPLKSVYVAAGDPAYRNNAFGFAMGHRESDRYVIDLMHRFYNPKGEIDANEPRFLVDKLKGSGFNIFRFMTDTWQFPETLQHIRDMGIDVVRHTVDLETYSFLKELIYSGQLSLYNHDYAIDELKSLELVKGKKVDHRSGFSKDIADAIANCCWGLREPKPLEYDTKILRG